MVTRPEPGSRSRTIANAAVADWSLPAVSTWAITSPSGSKGAVIGLERGRRQLARDARQRVARDVVVDRRHQHHDQPAPVRRRVDHGGGCRRVCERDRHQQGPRHHRTPGYLIDGQRRRRYYRAHVWQGTRVGSSWSPSRRFSAAEARRPLDPSTGTGGSAAGAPGRAGARRRIVADRRPDAGRDPVTPRPRVCGCAPGAGIDLLDAGATGSPTRCATRPKLSSRPTARPSSSTSASRRRAAAARRAMFRWKSGDGPRVVTERAWAFAVSADGARALGVRADGDGPFIASADGTTVELPLGTVVRPPAERGRRGGRRARRARPRARRWPFAGPPPPSLTTLGDLAGGPDYSEPIAINADASVVVGYGNTARGQEPFLWTRAAGWWASGHCRRRRVQTVARATNEDGGVVVGSNLTDGGTAIFRWTASGGMAALGTMFDNAPAGGSESYFIVADAAVAGQRRRRRRHRHRRSEPRTRWSRWRSGGRRPVGASRCRRRRASIVRAISADGRRIAGSTLASGAPPGMPFAPLPYQGFLFEEGRGRVRSRMCSRASISEA